ncbi:hypothetical protein B4N89_00685 [Embleya scabrispora]|uniref:Alpha/beta hydrolase n=1 Tax=Embleya scabrispora TaxID=159449 RepID=A0A1T3NS85_9ACTN|nr:hypothetical protein [Embleya scabrispora]OPC79656.1 hypothetical protein B4N89_00685 [Embleya scabrispora]
MALRLRARHALVVCLASVVTAGALAAAPATAGVAPARAANPPAAVVERVDVVGEYEATVAGDPATVYHPQHTRGRRYPVALLLQGADVPRAAYARYARTVASYGFIVVVPDHERIVFGRPMLFAEERQVDDAAAWMAAEDGRAGSPVAGGVDTANLVLLGHSAGGVAALYAVEGTCKPPFCVDPTDARPPQLRAAALYGTNSAAPGVPGADPIETAGVPVALIQGSLDGRASLAAGQATYDAMSGGGKALIVLDGANHYGVTDTQNPVGALPDANIPTLPQEVSVDTAAKWSAMWLRARLGDAAAGFYVYVVGDLVDANVRLQHGG